MRLTAMRPAIVLGLLGSLLVVGCSIPTPPLFRKSTVFLGVWGTSAKDVYAIGSRFEDGDRQGLILHYDGDRWRPLATGYFQFLDALWGSPTEQFAVGFVPAEGGMILHRRLADGRWNTVTKSTDIELRDVWGSSSSDVFAVGVSRWEPGIGSILHYDGNSWTSQNDTAYVWGVWGSSSHDVFAVGNEIFHFDGSWKRQLAAAPGRSLIDVWGTAGHDVFAVGRNGVILHYDGNAWRGQVSGSTADLYDIWGSSGSDVFAVGRAGTILHFDGSLWRNQSSGTTQDLFGVWGASASDVYVVGDEGTLLHYNGRTWNDVIGRQAPIGRPELP